MKRAVVSILVLAAAVVCLAQSSETTKPPLSADDVLRSYAQRVHAELMPRAGELSHEEIIQQAVRIAAEALAPHKNLLFEKAKAQLADLPKLTVDLDRDWETVVKMDAGLIAGAIAAELGRAASQSADQPAGRNAIFLPQFWNAGTTARFLRTRLLVRHFGPSQYGQRAMIESLAPPLVYAISADPQRPVIAIQMGTEMFVASLKHTEDGYYVDEKLQFLKRKNAASQPAPAADKGNGAQPPAQDKKQ